MDIDTRNRILSIVLGIIIIVLGYMLYDAIVGPYQQVIDRREMTERVRHRMLNVKDALVQYNRDKGHFPPTEGGLDTLVKFLKTDSTMIAMGDSLFTPMPPDNYDADSLIHSPRPPHKRFKYALNDSLTRELYLLEDPDTEDKIGSLENTTSLNAPNWR
jgi:type II secretory pathway pseudopilin PulG